MEKLKEAGLFGSELVSLSGSLAKRYNDCLALLGVAPTTLDSFAIDAMGWSPEIAQEKGDNYYLNIGDANTNAIIISPEQRDKPVHMPSHSFDRDLMEAVFTAFAKVIKDITKDSAICVHIDQKIDAFYEAFDLLRYDKITVTFELLNELDKKQQEQLDLIASFKKGNNFIDREIHKKIIDSGKTYGDLRRRKLDMEPMKLEVSSFYTRAFGGVFVLKDFIKDIMIFEDEAAFKKAIQDTGHDIMLFHKDHDELIEILTSHLVIEGDLKRAAKSARYDRIKKHRFSKLVRTLQHSYTEVLDSHFLFKKYVAELDLEVQKTLNGVDIFYQKVIINKELKKEDFIDDGYFKGLQEPHSSLEVEQQDLIWKLLVKIAPDDPIHLYWYDKATFYEAYTNWPPGYQDWVIKEIKKANEKA